MGIQAEQQVNLTLENVTVEAAGTNSYGVFANPKENIVQPVITVKGDKTKISGNVAGIAVNGYVEAGEGCTPSHFDCRRRYD